MNAPLLKTEDEIRKSKNCGYAAKSRAKKAAIKYLDDAGLVRLKEVVISLEMECELTDLAEEAGAASAGPALDALLKALRDDQSFRDMAVKKIGRCVRSDHIDREHSVDSHSRLMLNSLNGN